MTDDEIRAECIRRDQNPNAPIWFIRFDERVFKLYWEQWRWNNLFEGERWCIVKNGNLFDSQEAVEAAIARALQR